MKTATALLIALAFTGCVTSQKSERMEGGQKITNDAWQFRVLGFPVVGYSCETKVGEK